MKQTQNFFINVSRGHGTGYIGSYPKGYLKRIQEIHGKGNDELHLFAGMVQDATTLDINGALRPSVVAVADKIPFKDNHFDRVYADPPYDQQFTIHYSDYMKRPRTMPRFRPYGFLQDCFRILKPGGLLIVLHWLVYPSQKGFRTIGVHAVNQGPNHRIRVATVLEKPSDTPILQTTLDRNCLT